MGVPGGKQSAGGRACGLLCPGISIFFGTLFLLLGIWCTHLYQRFSPLYSDIRCDILPPTIDRVWFDHGLVGLHIRMITRTECHNPNPYEVTVGSSKAGRVYMGKDRTLVGEVTKVPTSTLPAFENGTISATVVITPTADVFGSVMQLVFAGHIPVYMENNMNVSVDVELIFGHVKVDKAIDKDCGMNMKMVGFMQAVVGPMVCADEFDQLPTLPAVTATQPSNRLIFSADSMGDNELEKATALKDTSLGVGMGVGYGLGVLFLLCGVVGACRWRRARMERAASAREMSASASNANQDGPPRLLGHSGEVRRDIADKKETNPVQAATEQGDVPKVVPTDGGLNASAEMV